MFSATDIHYWKDHGRLFIIGADLSYDRYPLRHVSATLYDPEEEMDPIIVDEVAPIDAYDIEAVNAAIEAMNDKWGALADDLGEALIA